MLLFSIAVSAGFIGLVLIGVFAIGCMIEKQFSGNPFRIFLGDHGARWEMVFLLVYSNTTAAWGITTAVSLGYYPIDVVVVVITAAVVLAFAIIVIHVLAYINDRAYWRSMEKKEQRRKFQAQKMKDDYSSEAPRPPVLNDPFFNEAVPMGILDLENETPESKGTEKR